MERLCQGSGNGLKRKRRLRGTDYLSGVSLFTDLRVSYAASHQKNKLRLFLPMIRADLMHDRA